MKLAQARPLEADPLSPVDRRDLARLEQSGMAPVDNRPDAERLAWGLLMESADRLRYVAGVAVYECQRGDAYEQAALSTLRQRLEEVEARIGRLERKA